MFSIPLNLGNGRLHSGLPAITRHAVIDVAAITLGNDIYFNGAAQFTITNIAHELVHTEQYARYAQAVSPRFAPFGELSGIAEFGIQYGGEYYAHKALGKSDEDAYNAISFEREANGREADIVDKIKETYGSSPCGISLF